MSIAKRLSLLLAIPVLILIVLGVLIRQQLLRIEDKAEFMSENVARSFVKLAHFSHDVSELEDVLGTAAQVTNAAHLAELKVRFDDLGQEAIGLLRFYEKHLVADERDRQLIQQCRAAFDRWLAEARKNLSSGTAGQSQMDHAQLQTAVSLVSSGSAKVLQQVLDDLIAYKEVLTQQVTASTMTTVQSARKDLFVAIAICLLLSALIGLLTSRSIISPIRSLTTSVECIAGGDYSREVPFQRAMNEAGGLARSIEVLKQGAAAMAEQHLIKENTARIVTSLNEAASVAEFADRLLSGLAPSLGGVAARFYVNDCEVDRLRLVASFGSTDGSAPEAIAPGDGLVGRCALKRQFLACARTSGDESPIISGRSILGTVGQPVAWPLLLPSMVPGVLEVVLGRDLGASDHALLAAVLPVAALMLDNLQRSIRTAELVEKLAEQHRETKATEAWFRQVVESAPGGILVADEDGIIVYSNHQAEEILGYAPGEIIGMRPESFLPEGQAWSLAKVR